MPPLQILYAVLTVLGLAGPMYFNIRWMQAGGSLTDIGGFFGAGFATPAASSLSTDLTVAFVVFLVWMIVEAGRIGMRNRWVYVLAGFAVAFAFAFPLFLLMRERHLRSA